MSDAYSRRGRAGRQVLILCLGALFVLLAAGVALLSGSVYRAVVAAGDANFTRRTALSYVVNQVRRGDTAGGVAVGAFGGSDAIRLSETLDGSVYDTLIYCYDGQLMELYTERDSGLGPEDGTAVLELAALDVRTARGRLELTVTGAEGETWSVSLAPRCGIEEVGAL